MNSEPLELGTNSCESVFRDRCQALRMPAWACNEFGQVITSPNFAGLTGEWLGSDAMRQEIEAWTKQWVQQSEPKATTLFPGCWLMPFVHRYGSQLLGLSVVMALDESLDDRDLATRCHAAALSADKVRRAVQPMLHPSPLNIGDFEKILQWSHDDLVQGQWDRRTLDEYGDKLAASYEEVSMLHRLGQTMNRVTDPPQFVSNMCEEMIENLPFGWIAIYFHEHDEVLPQLAGRTEVAGKPPCSLVLLRQEAEQLIQRADREKWQLLPDPEHSELPRRADSEVVVHRITHDQRIIGLVLAGNKGGEDRVISSVETKFLEASADFLGIYHENTSRYEEQRTLFLGTLQALTASIDAKDHYTRGHSERVATLAQQLALEAGMGRDTTETYRIAGLVHDVGKIGIPETVLCKAGRLTDEEFDQIKRHPVIGYRILKDIPPLADVLPGVLHHHERWDGKGYPNGLRGKEIPLIGRVLCVADSFDAMSSSRSYRPAITPEAVMQEFARCAGSQFDPDIASHMPKIDLTTYQEMMAHHQTVTGFAA